MNDDRTIPSGDGVADEHPSDTDHERSLIYGAIREARESSDPDAPTSVEGSSPMAWSHEELPVDAFPGYEITKEVHRGGQGVVYQAVQLSTKRKVAIKVMHGGATLGSAGKARFEREVTVLGQLNHPNIVNLHDSGITQDGSFFYVMDYISGKPLDEIIREQRRSQRKAERDSKGRHRSRTRLDGGPSIDESLRLFIKVCQAVNAAHLRGVIHRDIKPANVRINARGEPIVVDFGLAKTAAGVESDIEMGGPMTMTGQFIGSLPWASPEQAAGMSEGIDVRTDVYSLGVVLYQMLTGGHFPYSVVGNMRDVLDNIMHADPSRPSTIRRRINDEIETIVLKALAKDRDRRYQSAGELARDIEHYLAGEPIEAKRDSGWYVIKKTVRRHKVPAAFAASVALMTVAFGVGMSGLWQRAEAARDVADEQRDVAVDQRDRAESNLRAVRDLANTFLFDFHDSIENLRGATPARELILENALEYLDRVQDQAIDDPEMLLELAAAHEKVGDIRGGLYMPSTGTTDDAETHYAEALRLREAVLAVRPDNTEVLSAMASSWAGMGGVLMKNGRFDDGIDAWQRSGAYAKRAGDTTAVLEADTRVGDIHRRISRSLADDAKALDQLGLAGSAYDEVIAGWAEQQGEGADRARGRMLYKRALVHAERAKRLRKTDAGAASQAAADAIELSDRAVSHFEQLIDRDPASALFARDLFLALHNKGLAIAAAASIHDKLGNTDEATELREQALEAYKAAQTITAELAQDLSNLEAQRDNGHATNEYAYAMLELDQFEQSGILFSTNLELWQSLYRSDPILRHLRDLGVGEFRIATCDENRASSATIGSGERQLYLRSALSAYQRALGHFNELASSGVSADSEIRNTQFRIERVERLIEDG